MADPTDPNLKGRLADLRRVRDSASEDVKRAESRSDPAAPRMTPELVKRFGAEARKRLRDPQGSFRRHSVQAVVQRVDVPDEEIRLCGAPERLWQAISGVVVGSDTAKVRGSVPSWLRG